jgi:hypothetical protein
MRYLQQMCSIEDVTYDLVEKRGLLAWLMQTGVRYVRGVMFIYRTRASLLHIVGAVPNLCWRSLDLISLFHVDLYSVDHCFVSESAR